MVAIMIIICILSILKAISFLKVFKFLIGMLYSVLHQKAAAIIPHIGYVGWDIAVTPDGAVLIEGNNDPGYTAYQLPLLTNTHHGTMALFKPFL